MHRLFELCLLALTLTGLYFVWQSGQQRSAARAEYERLVRLTGDLPITDVSKIHALALETGESLHFAWRVYLPPNCRIMVKHNGGSSSLFRSNPQHLIARVRFREQPPGRLQVYTRLDADRSTAATGYRRKWCVHDARQRRPQAMLRRTEIRNGPQAGRSAEAARTAPGGRLANPVARRRGPEGSSHVVGFLCRHSASANFSVYGG